MVSENKSRDARCKSARAAPCRVLQYCRGCEQCTAHKALPHPAFKSFSQGFQGSDAS